MLELPTHMNLTIPNLLTLARILAVPFFAIAFWYGERVQACLIFAAAGLTDLLDGFIARTFNQRSALGAVLDPAADKLLMTTAFLLLAFPREALVGKIPAWVAILAITRDVVIGLFALLSADHFKVEDFKPSLLGKATTAVELMAISFGLLISAIGPRPWAGWFVPWVYYLVAGLVIASGCHYFFRAARQKMERA